ncbi:MAG: glycosyltransferase [Donghicola eburneus]|nr:glycosyltransferase [Donghicola eburneus]MCI5040351.1 glycosyltransferase [Donghicola eburneus]
MLPDTQVDLLAFAAPKDIFEPLAGIRKTWLPSNAMFTNSGLETLSRGEVLPPESACDAILILEQLQDYDYIFVRGREAAWNIAQIESRKARLVVYLTDIEESLLWEAEEDSEELQRLQQTISEAALVLCQTPQLGALVEELAPAASQKVAYLPPMVPNEVFVERDASRADGPIKMLYAGKFATEWAIDELLDISRTYGTEEGGLSVEIFGDKFNKSNDGFVDRARSRLAAGEGFVWHGAVSRKEMLARMSSFDIGYAFRHTTLDGSPEISTKLIEYAASGVAPILNRTPTHEDYFGVDYPLFANTVPELEAIIADLTAGAINLGRVLDHAKTRIQRHKMANVALNLNETLTRIEPLPSAEEKAVNAQAAVKPSLLIAGHDLKFMGDLKLKLFNDAHYRVHEVRWPRFQGGGEEETLVAMKSAHVVFCEWALENAVFCSRNKQPGQKLIVRFHRFELTTGIPQRIEIDNVDAVVTVSEHMANHLHEAYNWPKEKIFVLPNSIDTQTLNRPKTAAARFNLGVLGALPMLKRFDLALDLLEKLRSEDPRFTLHVKSKMPWEMPWIWNSENQFAYFSKSFDRIRRNHNLHAAVQLDRHGPDVPRWFQKIGWILSLSDVESFHLAGIEGMASGALPMVGERPGASSIFPPDNVFPDVESIAQNILEQTRVFDSDEQAFIATGDEMKALVAQYDREEVMQRWLSLFDHLGAI